MRRSIGALTILFAMAGTSGVAGQMPRPSNLAIWTGYSFESGGPFSPLKSFKLLLIGVRYERPLLQSSTIKLGYTLDLIPVAVIPNNIQASARFDPDRGWTVLDSEPRVATWGAGIMPMGICITAFPSAIVQPFAAAAMGGAYFGSPIPAANGRRFNFSAEAGGGIRLDSSTNWGIDIGFKLHHLSNAGTGEVNPGLDSKVFYIGITAR